MRGATQSLQLISPAKLNLFLHIVGQREDGYHNLQTIFQFIDFSDQLTFRVRNDNEIKLTPTLITLSTRENLITRAAKLLRRETGCVKGVDIVLSKNLPMGAGLGGGSSNAATTLVALNQLWDLNLSRQQLMDIGLELGADVPIFIYGHSAWAEGLGNEFTSMILPNRWYLLVIPPCHVNTRKMFIDERLTRDTPRIKITDYRAGVGHNDFEPLVRQCYPEVDAALNWLSQFGDARMSGSGGVVFLGFDSLDEASRIAARVPKGLSCKVARGLNRSPLYQQRK